MYCLSAPSTPVAGPVIYDPAALTCVCGARSWPAGVASADRQDAAPGAPNLLIYNWETGVGLDSVVIAYTGKYGEGPNICVVVAESMLKVYSPGTACIPWAVRLS